MYENVVVKKPWGEEYLLFENANIAIWHLKINPVFETSLHCHPNKKTGLIVLGGEAEVDFLGDKFRKGPADKIMIRQGVFHRTRNVGASVLELLEIETPNNKADIVRLEDRYGRAHTPYENSSHFQESHIKLLINRAYSSYRDVKVRWLDIESEHECAILVSGNSCNLMAISPIITSREYVVFGAGDIINNKILGQLLDSFEFKPGRVLQIEHL